MAFHPVDVISLSIANSINSILKSQSRIPVLAGVQSTESRVVYPRVHPRRRKKKDYSRSMQPVIYVMAFMLPNLTIAKSLPRMDGNQETGITTEPQSAPKMMNM